MKKRTRIVILGWYGSNNTGDEALVQIIVSQLREHGFNDLVALSTDPAKTGGRLGIRSVPRSLLKLKALREMRGANALILGGGGLIQDGTSVYNLPVYAVYALVARLLGLKVIGWGLGAEPLWTPLGRLLARIICGLSDYFSVRDLASKRLLVRAGVKPERLTVTADPAILLEPDPVQPGWVESSKPTVIFCIRHIPVVQPGFKLLYLLPVSVRVRLGLEWKQEPGRVEGLVEGVARMIKVAVTELGARAALLPFWPGRDDEVLDLVANTAVELGVPADSIERAQLEYTPGSFSAYVGKADLLVSMRLHALIFAARQGVPMIALSYARKVRGFMHEIGADRWTVEIERQLPQPDEMVAKLRELWAVHEQESRRLAQAASAARQRATTDAQAIAAILKQQ